VGFGLFLFGKGMDCWMLELTTDSLACLWSRVSVCLFVLHDNKT
jgi:hypothetical protein